jgi:cell division protease FtsH
MARVERRTRFSIWYNLLVVAGLLGLQILFFSGPSAPEVPYSDFLDRVDAGQVETVVLTDQRIYGLTRAPDAEAKTAAAPNAPSTTLEPPSKHTPWRIEISGWLHRTESQIAHAQQRGRDEAARHFVVTRVADPGLLERLRAHGVGFAGRIESHFLRDLFANWLLPFALLLLVWVFVFRRMGGGPQALRLGNGKVRLYEDDPNHRVTFADVAGVDEAIEEVREVVAFLADPASFTRLGAKLPKGVLLVGPPGTGKTLLARAVAGESGVPFFNMSGSDFVEMFVGLGASRVRELFAAAKQKAPCIVFIDELDALGKSRGQLGVVGGHDERENTLNQLLVEMDGFDARVGVVLMAATNRPEVLDPALLRPGRFDRQVLVGRPHRDGRLEIFRLYTKALPLAGDVDLERLAAETAGMVGADIANLCNEAALLGSRRGHDRVTMRDFQDAFERLVGGIERKGKVLSEAERRVVAVHESGHALVGYFTPGADPVQRISIVPRGQGALGYTLATPDQERNLMSHSELLGRIRTLLGGRAAEQLVFGETSTGAADDLEKANTLARAMIDLYGMSERLPNLSLGEPGPATYLGAGPSRAPHSAGLEEAIDEERQRLIGEAYAAAQELLAKRRERLDALAQLLLEREKLDESDLVEILGPRPSSE